MSKFNFSDNICTLSDSNLFVVFNAFKIEFLALLLRIKFFIILINYLSTAKQLLGLFFDTRGRCRQLAKKGEIQPIGSISFCVSETENNKRSAVVEVEVIADNVKDMDLF